MTDVYLESYQGPERPEPRISITDFVDCHVDTLRHRVPPTVEISFPLYDINHVHSDSDSAR